MFESMPQQNNDQETFVGRKKGEEEQGFDIGFAETLPAGIDKTSPLGVAELELIDKTVADDSGELHIYCLDAISAMTPAVFDSAIRNKDAFGAYLQVERAFQYNIKERDSMKTRLIGFIDDLLAQPEEAIVAEERSKLERLKRNILEESFSGVSEKTDLWSGELDELNETDRRALKTASEEAQKEIVPQVFERVLAEGDLILLEETLGKAKQLLLPEYNEMKSRALAFVEKELEKDDVQIHHDYQARLENLKSRILDLTEAV